MQKTLVGGEPVKAGPGSLTISNADKKQVLTKPQQTFNRLIKRIEQLRVELKATSSKLDEKLAYYGKHIYTLEKEVKELRMRVTKMMFPYYTGKKALTKKEKDILKDVLDMQIEEILPIDGEPDEEFKKIYNSITGVRFEDAVEEDFLDMKTEVGAMFEQMGFDVNLDSLHSKMTPEEMAAKMAEMQQQFEEHANSQAQQKASAKKTKKEQEKEDREKQVAEAKKKNISTIYRQLAKLLHPDLETDTDLKLEKEELMKQLTAAYESNDLHTLLRLELQWIQKEENNFAKLTDDKLSIYNEVMKEQVAGLEDEIFALEHHPRFEPLRQLEKNGGYLETVNLGKEKKRLTGLKKGINKTLVNMEKGEAFAIMEIKSIISYHRRTRQASNYDTDFENMILEELIRTVYPNNTR